MPNIKLKNKDGIEIAYSNVDTIKVKDSSLAGTFYEYKYAANKAKVRYTSSDATLLTITYNGTTYGGASGDFEVTKGDSISINAYTTVSSNIYLNNSSVSDRTSAYSFTVNEDCSIYHNSGDVYIANLTQQTIYNGTTASDVVTGHSVIANGALINGSIPSKSAATYNPTTTDFIISSGQYLSGNQTIAGDANLVPGNIKYGVTLYGVAGEVTQGATANPITVDTSTVTPTSSQAGMFVVDSITSKMYRVSTNPGNEWGVGTSISPMNKLYSIAYGNGMYIAVGGNNYSYSSTDGINWTAMTGLDYNQDQQFTVVYGRDGRFVCACQDGIGPWYTDDGLTWTRCGASLGGYLIYANNLYMLGYSTAFYTSSDGVNWTQRAEFGYSIKSIYYDLINNRTNIILTGPRLYYSYDTINWTSGSTNIIPYYISYGNGTFVAVNGRNIYYTNSTASSITWSAGTGYDTSISYTYTLYAGGKFIVVGTSGKSYQSTDGINWTAMTGLDTSAEYRSICYDGTKYLCAGGSGQTGYTSPDGSYLYYPLRYDF